MTKEMAGRATLEVYNPTGAIEVALRHAPRLDSLEGKTICEISDAVWENYRIFPEIRQLMRERFPTATIIPYSEFPTGLSAIDNDEIAHLVKKKGCNGVIVGNAA